MTEELLEYRHRQASVLSTANDINVKYRQSNAAQLLKGV